jgi:hypothetical protein
MLRNIFAIILGLFAMAIVTTFAGIVGMKLFPVPVGLSLDNPKDAPAILAAMPQAVKLLIVAGACLGPFLGAAIAARLAEHRRLLAGVIGALAAGLNFWNAQSVPYPQWMLLAVTILPLPLALIAERMVPPRYRGGGDVPAWRGGDK